MDYCLRVGRAGYRVVFTPYAELSVIGPEPQPSVSHTGQAAEAMRRVWADVVRRDPHYNPNLTRQFLDYRPRLDESSLPTDVAELDPFRAVVSQ